MSYKKYIFSFFLILTVFFSCRKENKVVIENNNAPYYDKIPRVKVENYVNRLYIDLIGREPFDDELKSDVDNLMENSLSSTVRENIILKLQTDETHRLGDSSYRIAYHKQLYNLLCVRLCEGFTEYDFLSEAGLVSYAALIDSLNGNWASFYNNKRIVKELKWAANARWDFMKDSIDFETYCIRLVNNDLTFNKTTSYMGNEDNTIKYTFDDFFFRPYTTSEFLVSRNMILNGTTGILFGRSGHSKGDYFDIICHSREFYEGAVIWLYKLFTSRYPTTEERINAMNILNSEKDIIKIQRTILKTDAYANF